MMKNVLRILSISFLTSVILYGCYPKEDSLYYADLDIAVTNFDEGYDFNVLSNKICVVFDTVAHVIGEDADAPEGKYDQLIIDEVLDNLQATGFDTVYLVKNKDDIKPGLEPHMAMTITAWETDYYSYYYYPYYDYWYWGSGWYWKSADLKSANNIDYYYYPGYPWGGGWSYSYSTGTIVMDLVNAEDMDNSDSTDDMIELPIIWTGIINGLSSENTEDQSTRITDQIEQVFTQSPYLFN